jgi:hypothetical protein
VTTQPSAMSTDAEAWAPIPRYQGLYEASSLGRIRSLRRKGAPGGVIRQTVNMNWYLQVGLCRNGRRVTRVVHQLIASAFLGPPPPGLEIRHLNGDQMNNRSSNLAYGTRSQNELDKTAHGGNANARKTKCRYGHPFDETNTYQNPSQPRSRRCRQCVRDRQAAYRRRRKSQSIHEAQGGPS